MQKLGERRIQVQPQFRQIGNDTIISSTGHAGNDRREERYQVIRFGDGKITDMQGFTSLRAAERFARCRSRSYA